MITKEVTVSQVVKVTVDEAKFSPEFLTAFRRSFYQFDSVDDHVEHLAQLYLRGLIDGRPEEFIEGYGVAREMGIAFEAVQDAIDIEITR